MEKIINEEDMKCFEKLVEEGVIEIFDYYGGTREEFLNMWNVYHSDYYTEKNDMTIYIGIKGKDGKFYECYEDFYYINANTNESEQYKLLRCLRADERTDS